MGDMRDDFKAMKQAKGEMKDRYRQINDSLIEKFPLPKPYYLKKKAYGECWVVRGQDDNWVYPTITFFPASGRLQVDGKTYKERRYDRFSYQKVVLLAKGFVKLNDEGLKMKESKKSDKAI